MRRSTAKFFLCIMALSVAVPESYAARLGGGRSVGRQAPVYRQRSAPAYQPRQAPAPGPMYVPRQSPGYGRQSAPMSVPMQPNYARQRGSAPWGGMLGGALVGLGLGSLMSSHARNDNLPANADGSNVGNPANANNSDNSAPVTANADGTLDPNAPNQMSGGTTDGTTAGGAGQATQAAPSAAVQPAAAQGGGFGSTLLWGLLAVVAFMLFRRSRARSARRP